MSNILQIVPTEKSAITTLARAISKHCKTHQFKLITFHPKKPNAQEVKNLTEGIKWCDIIDAQYWKSASKARDMFPDLWKTKKKILTHYNPYNLHEEKWEEYNKIVVVNNYQKSQLPQAHLIPMGVDLEFFKFGNYTKDQTVNMVVSRIEGKKGVQEVAQACKELKYKFILVGRISDANYMNRVKEASGGFLEFYNDISDKELRNHYYRSAIHILNSVPNYESGTLPLLEAMGCGVPVIAGKDIGHVPDIYNGKNLQLFEGYDDLKVKMKELMEDIDRRKQMRIEARESIKDRTHQIYSKAFDKIYDSL